MVLRVKTKETKDYIIYNKNISKIYLIIYCKRFDDWSSVHVYFTLQNIIPNVTKK